MPPTIPRTAPGTARASQVQGESFSSNTCSGVRETTRSGGAEATRGSMSWGLYTRYEVLIWRAAIAVTLLLWALLINMCYRMWT